MSLIGASDAVLFQNKSGIYRNILTLLWVHSSCSFMETTFSGLSEMFFHWTSSSLGKKAFALFWLFTLYITRLNLLTFEHAVWSCYLTFYFWTGYKTIFLFWRLIFTLLSLIIYFPIFFSRSLFQLKYLKKGPVIHIIWCSKQKWNLFYGMILAKVWL